MTPRLKAAEVVARDTRLAELRIERPDMTWPQIAAALAAEKPEWELTHDAARKIYRDWSLEEGRQLTQEDALTVINEKLVGFRKLRVVAGRVAQGCETGVCEKCGQECGHTPQPSVVLGAIRTLADLHQKELELRQDTGLMPRDLGALRIQLDARVLIDVTLNILESFRGHAPAELFDKAEDDLMRTLNPGRYAQLASGEAASAD